MEILDDQLHSHKDDKPSLEELKQNGYTYEFSRYWDVSVELFKKCWGWVGLYILVITVAGMIFGSIPGLNIVWQIIGGVLSAGIICHCLAPLKYENPNFGDFFQVFKYIGPLIAYRVIIGLIPLVFFVPLIMELYDSGILEILFDSSAQMEMQQDPEMAEEFGMALIEAATNHLPFILIGSFISLLLMLFTYFVYPLIIVGKLSLIDAIKHSFHLVMKNPIRILGYIILSIIIGSLGLIVCCIGVIFTVGFVEIAKLAMYSEIVGIQPKDQNVSEID